MVLSSDRIPSFCIALSKSVWLPSLSSHVPSFLSESQSIISQAEFHCWVVVLLCPQIFVFKEEKIHKIDRAPGIMCLMTKCISTAHSCTPSSRHGHSLPAPYPSNQNWSTNMYVSIGTGEQDEDDNILINVINCSFYEVPQVEKTAVSLPLLLKICGNCQDIRMWGRRALST